MNGKYTWKILRNFLKLFCSAQFEEEKKKLNMKIKQLEDEIEELHNNEDKNSTSTATTDSSGKILLF